MTVGKSGRLATIGRRKRNGRSGEDDMNLYVANESFYLGNIYYHDSFDFCKIEQGETIGVLSGSPSVYVKGQIVGGLPVPGAYAYLTLTGTVPDPAAGGAVPAAPVAAPATPTSPGTQGTWAYDGIYLYWCCATDVWIRMTAIRTW
jgi:hypothetical protein